MLWISKHTADLPTVLSIPYLVTNCIHEKLCMRGIKLVFYFFSFYKIPSRGAKNTKIQVKSSVVNVVVGFLAFFLFLFSGSQTGSCVEFEKDDVSVLNCVISSLLTVFSGSFCRSLRSSFFKIRKWHDLRHNEAFFKVRMNSTSSLRSLCSFLKNCQKCIDLEVQPFEITDFDLGHPVSWENHWRTISLVETRHCYCKMCRSK